MLDRTISHYKVIEPLGVGGMGEVYLAWDTDLDRKVALKFLSRDIDRGADARFRREAKAAAGLSHPNVVTVYEIGEQDGTPFIAMEYVEGKSLRRVMASSTTGKLPWIDAVEYGCQICRGLSEAHRTNIVHRDIKPENLLINARNGLKVADFGLATIKGATKLTHDGSTPGTLCYMSPEQIQGLAADTRSDIFSVGVVLYEMIAGCHPFMAEHDAAVAYQIAHRDPVPLKQQTTDTPPALQSAIHRALARDPRQRYQEIGELLADLEAVRGGVAVSPARARRKPKRVRLAPMLTILAVVLAAGAVARIAMKALNGNGKAVATPSFRQLSFDGSVYAARDIAAISPDGQFAAYAVQRDSTYTVMVQDLAGGQPIEIQRGLISIDPLRWSPDGTKVAVSGLGYRGPNEGFHTWVVSRLGGDARMLPVVPNVCWSPDGLHLAGIRTAQKHVTFYESATADSVRAIGLTGDFQWVEALDWSPRGDRLALLTADAATDVTCTIVTIGIDGSQQRTVVKDGRLFSPRWSGDGGAIYYLQAQANSYSYDLMKIHVSPKDGQARGEPVVLQGGMDALGFGLSGDTRKLCYTKVLRIAGLWHVAVNGEKEAKASQLTRGTARSIHPRFSPDGRTLAFVQNGHLFLMPVAGGDTRQLTFLESEVSSPAWSPDGNTIAFLSGGKVWRIPSGGGVPRSFASTDAGFQIAWAPGRDILYQRTGHNNFYFLDPESETERPMLKDDSRGWTFWQNVSPDGRRVAFYWNRKDGNSGAWLVSPESGTERLLMNDGTPIGWSQDGAKIFVVGPEDRGTIYEVTAETGARKVIALLPPGNIMGGVTVTPDGSAIVCSILDQISDVWLLEGFDPLVQ